MGRFESPVGIVAGIVEEELKVAIAQCASGGVKIELGDRGCWLGGGLVVLGVELEHVVSVAILGCFDLLEDVLVAENPEVLLHGVFPTSRAPR